MATPCFNALMAQFNQDHQPVVLAMMHSMIRSTRMTWHIVIQGPSASGKSSLAKFITALMAYEPGMLYPCPSSYFWGEGLVEKRLDKSGVTCWTKETGFDIWSKDKQTLFQKPVIAIDPDPQSVQHLHYLAPIHTNQLRQINRKDMSSIGFHDWHAPILVTTSQDLGLDPAQFHTVHMNKIKDPDPEFFKKLLHEVGFVSAKLKVQD